MISRWVVFILFSFNVSFSAFAISDSAPNTSAPSPALIAEKITQNNIHKIIRGSSAIAGLDDWFLSNGVLCASISASEHETYLSWKGGTLVDLGFCNRQDDQWNTYHELFNLSQSHILPATDVEAFTSETEARIKVTGKTYGVENTTEYIINLTFPNQLSIKTKLTRMTEDESFFLFGSVILHPDRALAPFVIATKNSAFSKGFDHPYVDTNDKIGMLSVMYPADLHVLVGPDHIKPEISYGVLSESVELQKNNGKLVKLKQFAINNQNFTLIGNFSSPLWFDTEGKPGMLQFVQTLWMDLEVGDSLLLKKSILLAKTADAAGVTDQLYQGKVISGRLANGGARILVKNNLGHPITYIKPRPDGYFSAVMPAGLKFVSLFIEDGWAKKPIKIDVDLMAAASHEIVVEIPTTAPSNTARLLLPKNKIMHLVFKGLHGTADPVFFADQTSFKVGQQYFPGDLAASTLSLAATEADIQSVNLRPGNYTVYATRGPEYSLEQTSLVLKPNQTQQLNIAEPRRQVETAGWINADFHLHSAASFDATLPQDRRVIDFVAQGGEVMTPTEHKRSVDFQHIIEKINLQDNVINLPGIELTGLARGKNAPRTIGHNNVFPIKPNSLKFLGGTLPHENLRLGQVINNYKKQYPQSVFQLNHPRGLREDVDDMNFFDHLSLGKGYQPNLPLDDEKNKTLIEKLQDSAYRDIDFDAIELLNGSDMERYKAVREDWFSLLSQGYKKTATANSDSHGVNQLPAMPRTYVRLQRDSISEFDRREFIANVFKGDVFGTTGPIIDVKLDKTGMGEIYAGAQGTLTVEIKVAEWIPVNQLAVLVNGKPYKTQSLPGPGIYSIPIAVKKDSYVTVEVSGNADGLYQTIYPGFTPFAFSNPIYIDADKNNCWQQPGL